LREAEPPSRIQAHEMTSSPASSASRRNSSVGSGDSLRDGRRRGSARRARRGAPGRCSGLRPKAASRGELARGDGAVELVGRQAEPREEVARVAVREVPAPLRSLEVRRAACADGERDAHRLCPTPVQRLAVAAIAQGSDAGFAPGHASPHASQCRWVVGRSPCRV